jgi:hypothetical protein
MKQQEITLEMLASVFAEDVVLEETRTVRGSNDTVWSDEKPSKSLLAKDYGEKWQEVKGAQARYKVFEFDQHEVKVRMNYGADSVERILRYAFADLWIKGQAKIRKDITDVGDEAYAKRLKADGGVVTFATVSDFEPRSRAATPGQKALGAVTKLDDIDDIAAVEARLAALKKEILAKRNVIK